VAAARQAAGGRQRGQRAGQGQTADHDEMVAGLDRRCGVRCGIGLRDGLVFHPPVADRGGGRDNRADHRGEHQRQAGHVRPDQAGPMVSANSTVATVIRAQPTGADRSGRGDTQRSRSRR